MFSKNTKIFLFLVSLLIFGSYGFMVGKYNWPPYKLLKSLNQELLQSQSSDKILKQITLEKEINFTETTLLPLSYKEYSFGNADNDFSTSSGAIRVFKNHIFILNKNREIFISDLEFNKTSTFRIEGLNDNNNAFFDKYNKDLRVHDLLIKERQGEVYLLLSYEKYHPESDKNSLNISSLRLEDNLNLISTSWSQIHQGSKIKYPDYAYSSGGGQLANLNIDDFIIANGDYNLDGWMNDVNSIPPSQDMSLTIGKIIKINFIDGKEEIISYGHRNPQGLSVSFSGRVLQAEHGPNGGDEINIINLKKLENYGWPYQSLGIQYADFSAPVEGIAGSHDRYSMPFFSFLPSIGISEVLEIEDFEERWNGDILIASLKSRSIYRLRVHEGKVIYSEPIWVGERIRDIKQAKNKIFLWLDNQNLRVYSVESNLLNTLGRHANQTELNTVLSTCLQCHHFGPTNPNHPAPTLSGLYDREIGSDPNYNFYSKSLKTSKDNWTAESLKDFIVNPQNQFPGSSMPSSMKKFTKKELEEISILLGNYSDKALIE